MAASLDNTWDLQPPTRPSLDDLGSATKEDDATDPPDAKSMPTAAEWNLFAKLLAQFAGGFAFSLKFQLTHGVSGSIAAQWQMGATAVALSVLKNGAGDYSVTWPANSFPTPIHNGTGWCVEAGAYCPLEVQPIANGVRCKLYDAAGVAADKDFIAVVP